MEGILASLGSALWLLSTSIRIVRLRGLRDLALPEINVSWPDWPFLLRTCCYAPIDFSILLGFQLIARL